jgi:acyl-CoA thioesterase
MEICNIDTKYLTQIYGVNKFVKLLDMRIVETQSGMAKVVMPVESTKHSNLYGVAHGGALASLADTAMGMACATVGNRVVTLDMNINYIKGAKPAKAITCLAKVVHCGKKTMVVESNIYDESQNLLTVARATFYVIGKFNG